MFLETLWRDLRYSARALAANKGFAGVAVVTLALGIGANTAVFTVTNALLLRPFPYRDPERLVSVAGTDKDSSMTLARYELVRDRNQSFASVAVWANDNFNLTGHGEPLQTPVARVSANFFSLFGVEPQLGRAFTADEGRPEGPPVAILSDSIWRSRFGADRNIIGRTITLDTTPHIVVGVMPANVGFPFVGPADIWTPRYFELTLMTPQRLRTGVGFMSIVARLRQGTTMTRAQADLAVLNRQYQSENPGAPDAAAVMTAEPLRDLVVAGLREQVLILSGAVGVVLLIACANVAALLLSRGLARRGEIAVRMSLGANRSTVARQLLTESVLLALIGGTLGTALSVSATRALATWGASRVPQGIRLDIDLRVLAFTLAVSVLTGIVFGTFPALQLARVNPGPVLRDGGRGVSTSAGWMKNLLLVAQVALALLLLIGAGLLVRSFAQLLRVDPGFDPHNVLTMNVSLPTIKYATAERQIAFFDEVLRRTSALPGVQSAAISAALPLSTIRITPVLPEGQPNLPLGQRPFLDIEAISPQWFRTMRVSLRAGREFSEIDTARAPKVVIVNESFARRFWPDQNPVGKRVIVGRGPTPSEVVGVAADVRNRGLAQSPQAQLYLPFPQLPWGNMNLLVRTAVAPLSLAPAVRAQISAVDADEPVVNIQTVDDLMDNSRAQPRFTMVLLGIFSATAFLLAAIGIYGVLAYSVAQRRHELGIRVALGAGRGNILSLVIRRGLTLTLAGIAIGLAAALFLTRLMASMLFEIGDRDPTTFIIAPLIFLAVALLASYLPAQRATKVDPMEALRA